MNKPMAEFAIGGENYTMLTCTACRQQFTPKNGENPLQCPTCANGHTDKGKAEIRVPARSQQAKPAFPGRDELWVGWSCITSDNKRKRYRRGSDNRPWAEYKAALERFRAEVTKQWQWEPTTGPVKVTLMYFLPDNRDLDLPNTEKAIFDGMKGIVMTDDKWKVMPRHESVFMAVCDKKPGLRIIVERYERAVAA